MTTEVVITATDDGSYRISGDVVVLDAAGNAFPTVAGRDVFLCRCGHSANKPFCDGSHGREGFSAVERAVVAGDQAAPTG
ncbi:MAG: Iron-binding zinc finger type [Frankiales bacterium]|jgi:CDGSH-type Zn-finger protein|nr:Iron-binding zinc finger type [Frankiales bacterium]